MATSRCPCTGLGANEPQALSPVQVCRTAVRWLVAKPYTPSWLATRESDRSALVHAYRSGPTDSDEAPGSPTTVLAWSTVPDGMSVRSALTTIADPLGRY